MTLERSAWRAAWRSRRRVATLASVALLLLPSSERFLESTPNAPTDPVAHAVVRLHPRYDPPGDGLYRPERVETILTLWSDSTGLLTRHVALHPARVAAVSWHRRGEVVELVPGSIGSEQADGLFMWERWTLKLSDRDGDGVLETGRGSVRGEWHRTLGDVVDFAAFEADVRVFPDTVAPTVRISFVADPIPLPVDDGVLVEFTEPVRWSADGLELRVDGHPEPARASHVDLVQNHAIRALLRLDRLTPFGAGLTIEAPLVDPAGHAARWDGDTLRTPGDPGPIGPEATFGEGLSGWIPEGPVSVVEAHPSGEPGRRALVASGGRLTGVIEVPDDAVALEMEIEVLSEIGQYDAGRSAVVDLAAAGLQRRVFDVSAVKTGGPCACAPYGTTTGPLEISASLEDLRGRHVLVSFAASGTGYLGMNEYAIAVRRVRVIGDAAP